MRCARQSTDAWHSISTALPSRGRSRQGLGLTRRVSLDPTQTLWRNVIQLPKNLRHQWFETFDPVALRFNDKNGNRQRRQILLKLDVLIHCQEDIKPGGRKRKKLVVDVNYPDRSATTILAGGSGE